MELRKSLQSSSSWQTRVSHRFTTKMSKSSHLSKTDPSRWFRAPDPAGKHRKSPEMEAVFRPEPGGKHWKKSENFPAGILLRHNHRNYPEPAVSGPDCSTWGEIDRNRILPPLLATSVTCSYLSRDWLDLFQWIWLTLIVSNKNFHGPMK
jgi:hypothetical protein